MSSDEAGAFTEIIPTGYYILCGRGLFMWQVQVLKLEPAASCVFFTSSLSEIIISIMFFMFSLCTSICKRERDA